MISLTEKPDVFELEFKFMPAIVKQVQAIPGKRWDPLRKIWKVPITQREAVEKLTKRFGVVNPDTRPEYYEAIKELPELTIDLQLKRELYEYQKKGVGYALQHKKLIIGDQPGLGKTGQAIAAIFAAQSYPCLIICPSSLKINWQREIKMWTGKNSIILTDSCKTTWPYLFKTGIADTFIVNYESLKKYFVESINTPEGKKLRLDQVKFREEINLFKSIIIDESHRVKEARSLQSKLTNGIAKNKEMVLALTGTPVVNKPRDLVSQLIIIGQIGHFGGFKGFKDRYCAGPNEASNLRELNYLLHKHCFYRREKKEVLTELPDKMRQINLCDISTRKEYAAAVSDLEGYMRNYKQATDEQIKKSMKGEIMVRIGHLKNISARGKLKDVIEQITDVVEQGEKVIVFVHLKEVAANLMKAFPGCVSITGNDNQEQRQRNVDAFQKDPKVQVIVCSIKAAGVGITLTASSNVYFVELPWHPADCEQCEDRCIAKGQLIMTEQGFKKVEDVLTGDMVYTAKGFYRRVTDTWSKLERKKSFYEINYKGFDKPLVVTEDHRVYAYDTTDGQCKYVEARHLDLSKHKLVFANPYPDVKAGIVKEINVDNLHAQTYKHYSGITLKNGRAKHTQPVVKLSKELMYAFGWYLAEGWSNVSKGENGSYVAVCGNDTTEKSKVEAISKSVIKSFGLVKSKAHNHSSKKNCYSSYIYSKNLAAFFIKHFGSGSENKNIPEFVFNTSKENMRSFLNGYYSGDGYKRKNTQQASTKSDKIAIGLCQLEALLGNPITLRKAQWGGWSFEYSMREQTTRETLIKNENNCVLFPIQEIRIFKPTRGKERVYDLTVEHDESFTVGLAAVHNCHRIGQKNSVMAKYFLGKDTIDEEIYKIIDEKRTISNAITGATDEIETTTIDRLINLFNQK